MFVQHLLYIRPWALNNLHSRKEDISTGRLRSHNFVRKFWFYTSAAQNREYFPEVTTESKKPTLESSLESNVTREDL